MQLTVLGGCGAWPAAGQACSGYLVEHDGFRLLIDPGYAVLPRLLQIIDADELDAVLVSHGHPDHCADLNPLLRARKLRDDRPPAPALPVYAPPGALRPVLALDRPGMLDDAIDLREFTPGDGFSTGPFGVRSWLLPHFVPNAGLRLESGGYHLAYTGDSGPSPDLLSLALDANLLLAEASCAREVPGDSARYLSSASQAGQLAHRAGVGQLILTHLMPETDAPESVQAAAESYAGPIAVAMPGLVAGPAGNGAAVMDEPWRQPLDEAWAVLDREAAGSPAWAGGLEVTGGAGRLPSRLPVEEVAIACAGAALLAAAALHAGRGGAVVRTLRLDRGHVAAAFRSEAWLRVNGEPAGAGFAPLSRFWRAADGWVRTHGNYPWHREALLRALGCGEDREAVAAAIADLGARPVEDLVTGAGGVAAAVRTEAEWRTEPAGQAVATAGLAEGGSLGDAPPRHRAAGARPASGIKVVDLTRVIAGPVATRYLAALGADVLRLDPPHRPELPLAARDGLLGKRSALLDFGTPDGSARLHELLAGADVLVHGYRPHALDRFGLAPQVLAERHPGLVVVSLSAWGSRGPWGGRRGFDSIVQAACGIAVADSPDGERPGALPCQLLDHGTGYLAAAAVLRALAAQATRGGTVFRELSLARTGQWLLSQPRGGTTPAAAPDGDPGAWLTTVGSAEGPVTVVRPLGRLDGPELAWPSPLTRYGSDPPAWR